MTEEKLIEIIRAELHRQFESEEIDWHSPGHFGDDLDGIDGCLDIRDLARAIITGIAP